MFTNHMYVKLLGDETQLIKKNKPQPVEQPTVSHASILETIYLRRNGELPRQDWDFYVDQQYHTVVAAAKIGCDINSLREALGNTKDIDKVLITRLVHDKNIIRNAGVEAIIQDYYLEKLEALTSIVSKITTLIFNLCPQGQNDITRDLIRELIDSKHLAAPTDANKIKAYRNTLENDVFSYMKEYLNANGSRDNPRFLNAIPVGTACKLLSVYDAEQAKENELAAALKKDLDLFR